MKYLNVCVFLMALSFGVMGQEKGVYKVVYEADRNGNMRAKFEVGEMMKDFTAEMIKDMGNSKMKTMWSVMVK